MCRLYYVILKNLKESFFPLPSYASTSLRKMKKKKKEEEEKVAGYLAGM